MFRILFMHVQLKLGSQNLKRRKKHSTKQFLKFRDSQGSKGSAPNSSCSPNPANDLGIQGLEGTLKATHSKLPAMQEFPLKPPQQVADPHIRPNACREGLPVLCWSARLFFLMAMGPEGRKKTT